MYMYMICYSLMVRLLLFYKWTSKPHCFILMGNNISVLKLSKICQQTWMLKLAFDTYHLPWNLLLLELRILLAERICNRQPLHSLFHSLFKSQPYALVLEMENQKELCMFKWKCLPEHHLTLVHTQISMFAAVFF